MVTQKQRWPGLRWPKAADLYQRLSPILTLAILYGTLRLLGGLFMQLTFAGYGPAFGIFWDQGRFSLAGAYPYLDYWSEYPPIFPWLNVLAYQTSLALPGDRVLWFGAFSRWILLPFDMGSVALVYLIARQLGANEEGAMTRALLFVAAFVTLYVPLGWFDALPVFWLLLAIYLTFRAMPFSGGLAAGIGFLTKPIVVVALPMMWQRQRPFSNQIRLLIGLAVGLVVPVIPFLLSSPRLTLAFLQNMLSRSSWETVWALFDGYRSYGAVAPLAERFDPASAAWTIHDGPALYEPWATLGFALLFLVLWTRRIDWGNNGRSLAFVALTWGLFNLWSKGYSPQWAINFVPFIALLLPNVRGAVYLLLLALGLVAEWPLAFTLFANQEWYFVAVILWRTALAVLLTVEFAALSFAESRRTRLARTFNSWGMLLLAAGIVIIGARALPRYVVSELAIEPLRGAIGFWQTEATASSGVVCRDVDVCERLAPYLAAPLFWLPDPQGWQARQFADFAARYSDVWLVEAYDRETGHDLSIERWLSDHYGKAQTELVEGARLSRFVSLAMPPPTPVAVTFADHLNLESYAYALEPGQLNLLLNWRNLSPVETPYKLFVHLVDGAGVMVAQTDQFPVGGFMPPNEWPPDSAIADRHGLVLPMELSTPPYRLRLGWYHPDTGERLPLTAPTGVTTDYWELSIQP